MDLKIDYLGQGGGTGEVAHQIQTDGVLDPGSMRPFIGLDGKCYISVYKGGDRADLKSYGSQLVTNATLRRDEWNQLDQALLQISRERLGGIKSLEEHGLVYNLGNAMGTTVLEYEDISEAMEAHFTMDGVTRGKGDRPEFTSKYLPIPILHVDYEINSRVLAASRNRGQALDTISVELAARRINEQLEDMLFTNTSYAWGNGTIYSYVNTPHRNQISLSVDWDASAKTSAHIVREVLDMKQANINSKHFGPYELYIPTAYETRLDEDYDARTPGTTLRERILKIDKIMSLKVIDHLPANNVLLVQMTSDVVRLVKGMGITNIEWKTEGKFITKYKVMTIQVPQIRADQAGNSGIVHLA